MPYILDQNDIEYELGPHGDIHILLNNPCIEKCILNLHHYINSGRFSYSVQIITHDPNYSYFGHIATWDPTRFTQGYANLIDAINDLHHLDINNIKG